MIEARLKELAASVNRWTENIFVLQSYCNNKFNINKADFAAQFEFPEDMDYVNY